jgi:hypothetical protein
VQEFVELVERFPLIYWLILPVFAVKSAVYWASADVWTALGVKAHRQ